MNEMTLPLPDVMAWIDELSNEEAGLLFRAIAIYAYYYKLPDDFLKGDARIVWPIAKQMIDQQWDYLRGRG